MLKEASQRDEAFHSSDFVPILFTYQTAVVLTCSQRPSNQSSKKGLDDDLLVTYSDAGL